MLPRYSNGTYHPSILGPSVVTHVKKERLAQTLDFAPRYDVTVVNFSGGVGDQRSGARSGKAVAAS